MTTLEFGLSVATAAILLAVMEGIKASCRLFDQMLLALVADETRETQE